MSKRKTTKEFIIQAKRVHGNKYDYRKVDYKNAKTKVIIICHKHGEFKQLPNGHIKSGGCADCGVEKRSKSRRLKESSFIKRCDKIHNNKYDYSGVKYKNMHTKVSILCDKHGEFKQIANDHIRGKGCQKCGDEIISEKLRNGSNGWKYSKWINSAEKSNNFTSFKLYIIKIFNNDEEFFKLGRTYTSLERRFLHLPDEYNYNIIYCKESNNARKICELEQEYKNICSENSYIPDKEFDGMYECYKSIDNLNITG